MNFRFPFLLGPIAWLVGINCFIVQDPAYLKYSRQHNLIRNGVDQSPYDFTSYMPTTLYMKKRADKYISLNKESFDPSQYSTSKMSESDMLDFIKTQVDLLKSSTSGKPVQIPLKKRSWIPESPGNQIEYVAPGRSYTYFKQKTNSLDEHDYKPHKPVSKSDLVKDFLVSNSPAHESPDGYHFDFEDLNPDLKYNMDHFMDLTEEEKKDNIDYLRNQAEGSNLVRHGNPDLDFHLDMNDRLDSDQKLVRGKDSFNNLLDMFVDD